MLINTKQGLAPVATTIIVLIVLALLGWAIYAGMDKTEDDDTGMEGESTELSEVTLDLTEQNNSGHDGEATIRRTGENSVRVSLELDNATSTPQPAHIHTGACPNPGAVVYPLTNVVNGRSETDLQVSLSALLAQLPLAINVHKSAAESAVYVACGDILTDTSTSTATTTSSE